ncbi:MAG: hypothetical protein HOM47_02740 [Euryarchaeota archaeon]|nr:hypothetical protein [Euryarchaeota archaeon]MBT5184073.1 hypothetical protein [Euryarchaeota archaeon]
MTELVLREMVTNRLLIDVILSKSNWAGKITAMRDDTFIQVQEQMFLDDEKAALRILIQGPASKTALEMLQGSECITITSIHEELDRNIELSLIVEGEGSMHLPLRKCGQILQTPYVIKGGHATWSFITDREGALKTKNALLDCGLRFEIVAFGSHKDARLLTPRQRDVFDAAVYNGYYDKPRKITLTGLATQMSMSKSSLCEMMHLIEKNIMHNFAEDVRMMSPLE